MTELGRIAFEAAKAVDPNAWMTPAWEDLGAARQGLWIAAANAVAAAQAERIKTAWARMDMEDVLDEDAFGATVDGNE